MFLLILILKWNKILFFRETQADMTIEEDESINQPYTTLHEEVKALLK